MIHISLISNVLPSRDKTVMNHARHSLIIGKDILVQGKDIIF